MRCNRRNWLILAGKYRRLELGESCVYCGEPAGTRDHFVPVAVAAMMADTAPIPHYAKVTLPACSHCNSVAGDKVFKTVGAKRRYIQGRLASKYRSLISTPVWDDDEIEELGRTLRTKILADRALAEKVRRRIAWRNGKIAIDRIGAPRALAKFCQPDSPEVESA